VEVHVRSARLTDLDAAIRILARDVDDENRRHDVDYLRNLLFVPSATVSVAERERRVVGVGVLSIRPAVRAGPFVGIIDVLGIAERATLGAADWRRVADEIVEHLATSARNKGCTRVEVSEPLVSAEPSLWKRLGFASRGRTLERSLGRSLG
jgi:predicted N-acetyltransferase YhbS